LGKAFDGARRLEGNSFELWGEGGEKPISKGSPFAGAGEVLRRDPTIPDGGEAMA